MGTMTARLQYGAAMMLVPALAAGITLAHGADAIVNGPAIAPFVRAASTQRVDIVMIGDSNQLHFRDGWDDGVSKAFADRFGMYATALLSVGENRGNGAGAGYSYQGFSTASTGAFQYAAAPAALEVFLQPDIGMGPLNYLWVPAGQSAGATLNQGLFIEATSRLGVNGALRFVLVYGTFGGSGPGAVQLSVRMQQFPFAELVRGGVIATQTGVFGSQMASLDLGAASRDSALNFRLTPWGQNIVGPALLYYMRAENLGTAKGSSVHTLYAAGGQSARDMAEALLSASDEYLTLYFSLVRSLQGNDKHVLIRINSGLNDRNEVLPSVGPSPVLDGASPEAFADNLQGIIDRIKQVWQINNWPVGELYFLLSPSHPVSKPDQAILAAYRGAAGLLTQSNPRTAMIDFSRLTDADEMLQRGWYQLSGNDHNHLTQAGYEVLAAREVQALFDAVCWVDTSNDGIVGFADVVTVMQNWLSDYTIRFNGTGSGDANGDGVVDFADITSVVANWMMVCP